MTRIFLDDDGEVRQRRSRDRPGLLSRRSAQRPRRFRFLHPPLQKAYQRDVSVYLLSCSTLRANKRRWCRPLHSDGGREGQDTFGGWQRAAIVAARRSYLHMTFPFPQGKALPTSTSLSSFFFLLHERSVQKNTPFPKIKGLGDGKKKSFMCPAPAHWHTRTHTHAQSSRTASRQTAEMTEKNTQHHNGASVY